MMNLFENLQRLNENNNKVNCEDVKSEVVETELKEEENLEEGKILKDEKDMEHIVESAQLRSFTGKDSWTWGGATNFADGDSPMIAESDFATLIVSGPDSGDTDGATVSIYYGDPESEITEYGFKCYDNKELALKDARVLVKLIDDEIDVSQLKRFGFEIMSFK